MIYYLLSLACVVGTMATFLIGAFTSRVILKLYDEEVTAACRRRKMLRTEKQEMER